MGLYFFIGAPRSGKSTISKNWLDKLITIENNEVSHMRHNGNEHLFTRPRVVLSSDAMRLAMHGQVYAKEAEGLVSAHIDIAARMFLNEGYDVLIDETNTTNYSLTRMYRLDQDAQHCFVLTSQSICNERAIATKQEYLLPVIDRCWKQMIWLKNDFAYRKYTILEYLKDHV